MTPRRHRTSTPATSAADTANGCAKGCVLLIAAIVVMSVGFGVWTWLAGSDAPPSADAIRMTGAIHLTADQCGFEQQVRINPRDRTPVLLQADERAYRPGQPCTIRVDTMVEPASSYEIDVKGVGKETFPHDLIDTRDANGRIKLDFELSFR